MKFFINWSNHPFIKWDPNQQKCAEIFGKVIDRPFPEVDPNATAVDIYQLAKQYVCLFESDYPRPEEVIVMIQGEMTLLYHMLKILEGKGYRVVAATSKREVEVLPDGKELKSFCFVGFRDYFTPQNK